MGMGNRADAARLSAQPGRKSPPMQTDLGSISEKMSFRGRCRPTGPSDASGTQFSGPHWHRGGGLRRASSETGALPSGTQPWHRPRGHGARHPRRKTVRRCSPNTTQEKAKRCMSDRIDSSRQVRRMTVWYESVETKKVVSWGWRGVQVVHLSTPCRFWKKRGLWYRPIQIGPHHYSCKIATCSHSSNPLPSVFSACYALHAAKITFAVLPGVRGLQRWLSGAVCSCCPSIGGGGGGGGAVPSPGERNTQYSRDARRLQEVAHTHAYPQHTKSMAQQNTALVVVEWIVEVCGGGAGSRFGEPK